MLRIGLKYHSAYPNAQETAKKLLESLDRKGAEVEMFQFDLSYDIPEVSHENMLDRLKELDLLISVGGDGTLLSSARIACFADLPVLGINAGRFGFLTEATTEELDTVTDRILSGKYRIEERRMIWASFYQNDQEREYIGLNDVIIHRQTLSRILTLETYLDDEYVATYEGDGLIIATPTGSTAYNLSAGGSIVHPDVDCLLLTPICPHTLSLRPMVIGPGSKIKIMPRFSGIPTAINITYDGQKSGSIITEQPIRAGYSSLRCRLVRLRDEGFFSLIRRKLHWGVLVR
jgi:NAD+ kinase